MSNDEADRVAFWIEYMDRSYALAEEIMRYPLAETGEGFTSIPDAMKAANVEVQFSTTKIGGQFERLFYIRASLIPDLIAIARDMNARGWILKIEDGYRTAAMQTALGRAPAVFDRIIKSCIRECGGARPSVDLVFRRAMCLVANVPATGTHLCGAAVDISVYRRDNGSEVWRGKPYLEMSEYTPMDSPFVSAEERANRLAITEVMERYGFMHYEGEFWHYNKGDSLYQIETNSALPGLYGPVHWDPATNIVTPFADRFAMLTPLDILEQLIEEAIGRLAVYSVCGYVEVQMDEKVAQALKNDQVIDITTTGRKTGESRRIEIWFHNQDGRLFITGTPGKRSWFANLSAHPDFTFHVKQSAQADLPARARVIDAEPERREILARILAKLNRSGDIETWVSQSPLVEVTLL